MVRDITGLSPSPEGCVSVVLGNGSAKLTRSPLSHNEKCSKRENANMAAGHARASPTGHGPGRGVLSHHGDVES